MGPVESIVVELFYVVLYVPTLAVGAIAVPVAGGLLLFIHRIILKHKITLLKEWKILLVVSALFAVTELTWYDAVSHIGAGKTALINLPLETVSISFLAWIILKERLRFIQIVGAVMVMTGVIIALSIDVSNEDQFGIGEIESVIASLSAAVDTILTVKLLSKYNTVEVTGFSLLLSGLMLQIQWFFNPLPEIPHSTWIYLAFTPFVPMILFYVQFLSYTKVGATLTSIITSVSIIITLLIQILLAHFGVPAAVPDNITMALIGGVISVIGICIIVLNEKKEEDVVQEKNSH